MLLLLVAVCAPLVVSQCSSGQKTAVGGSWSSSSAWCPAGVPADNDNVEVPPGVDILVDVSTARLGWVLIQPNATVRFSNGKGASDVELLFQAESIVDKGYLEMGRPQAPLTRPVRVKLLALTSPPARSQDMDIEALFRPGTYGKKMLAVVGNGTWDAHASGRKVMWTKLAATVPIGATSITLIKPVDWKAGDEIIIASTDYSPEETELRVIANVSADGLKVQFATPLTYGHYGVSKNYAGFNVDMRGEVGVLTSNFIIEGDMAAFSQIPEALVQAKGLENYVVFGGHTISVHHSFVRIEGVQFKNMGQGGRLARYPVHWHKVGYAPGQYIRRSSIHDSHSRGISIHDTKQLVIENTVVYNVYGHSIYLEDGTEELNQFYDNLVVTSLPVGKGADDYDTGSWKYPECGSIYPGIRLQYLDYVPSGFWITSANNTFVGNVAVGHQWGFWMRVDFVFSEPLFGGGCTVCCPPNQGMSCNCTTTWSTPSRRTTAAEWGMLNSNGEGLIFVDNVAHSNIEGGWWIKENWTPTNQSSNLIDGFLSYKNLVGVDNYGTANLKFNRIIVADNAGGIHIDWVRFGECTFSNSLLIGESENHGSWEHTGQHGITRQTAGTASASLVYPNANRTISVGMGNLGQYCLRLGETYHHLNDIVFLNCKKPMANWSPNPYIDDYSGNNYLGSLAFHLKGNWAGVDREMKGLYWVNSDRVSRMRGTKRGDGTKMDVAIPPYLQPQAPYGYAHDYNSGFHDVDGSFPCSQPGAWWLNNNPDMVPPECEYRNYSNMYYCAPGDYYFRQIMISPSFGYGSPDWVDGAVPILTWECGKVVRPFNNNNARRYTVHTKRNYVLSIMQSDGKTEVTYDQLAGNIGFAFESHPRWEVFEGMDYVVRVPGTWRTEYFGRVNFPPGQPPIKAAPASYMQTACACGVTYAKITVKGSKDGPWPGQPDRDGNATFWMPDRGWQVHFYKDNNVTCSSTCGNPFAAPTPANCNTPNAINNADLSTCAQRPAPTALRPWVTRPKIIRYGAVVDESEDAAVVSGAVATTLSVLSLLLVAVAF